MVILATMMWGTRRGGNAPGIAIGSTRRRRLRIAGRITIAVGFAVLWLSACEGARSADTSDPEARVRGKMEAFQSSSQTWIRNGGDASRVQSYGKQIDEKLRAGDLAGAEKLIDEGLALVKGTPPATEAAASSDAEAPDARMRRKLEAFQAAAPQYIQNGGDASRVQAYSERIDKALKAGDLAAGEQAVDEALKTVGASAPAPAAAARSAARAVGPQKMRLGKIPASATIVFHQDGFIYVTDTDGGNVTRITFDTKRRYEHVAVSHDRKRIAANYWEKPQEGGASSRLLVYDLDAGTETELVADFRMAGNGGVDWDRAGNIYFAGVQSEPAPNPRGRDDFVANAGANEIWRVKWDGSGLTRLTQTKDRGEADVSVSDDGKYIAYMATRVDAEKEGGTEIWMSRSDGSDRKLVYEGGKMGVTSVHDPELSDDDTQIVFSRVNPNFKNFRSQAGMDTAHDICVIKVDGSDFHCVTQPGPIAIIPDWKDHQILFLELTDRGPDPYHGVSVIRDDGTDKRRIRNGADTAKWIPTS